MKKTDRIKEAESKGFKSGVYFVSATGIPDCLVLGELVEKNFIPKDPLHPTKEEKVEMDMNGDIVSTTGYGMIYDASTGTWGQLMGLMMYSTSKTGTNARKVPFIDMDEL